MSSNIQNYSKGLEFAFKQNDLELAKLILSKDKTNKYAITTILRLGCVNSNLKLVQEMIEMGCDRLEIKKQ